MIQNRISDEYFNWLCSSINASSRIPFYKLLSRLHSIEFRYSLPMDANRASDGIDLRYRFTDICDRSDVSEVLDKPCSVLEMMIALAIRCEEETMDDPRFGDRTGQWFWNMVVNLGLGSMTDSKFDRRYVDDVIDRFLDREYESDGKGGLFRVKGSLCDLRTVEIWYQLCWYLDNLT